MFKVIKVKSSPKAFVKFVNGFFLNFIGGKKTGNICGNLNFALLKAVIKRVA